MVPKSRIEIEYMTKGGRILASILSKLKQSTVIGVSTKSIDNKAYSFCKENLVKPAFLGYEGFPASSCISINSTIVHGVPSDYVINDGDLVSIDFGIIYKGLYLDGATSFQVGKSVSQVESFLHVGKLSRDAGIRSSVVGAYVSDIASAMEKPVVKGGYSVVRELTGHGIGYRLHENPFIPGYSIPEKGMRLVDGMTLAIESMISMGSPKIVEKDNGWDLYTKDGSLTCHFEHTILVSGNTPRILTQL
jgi:methionyl aminopeptidase